jgi:2-polyprenyl-3-methyl-5-hydroxy-6-metoxy-1,4-benzoquinol methylase
MSILSNYISLLRIKHVLPYVKGSVLDLGCGEVPVLRVAGDKIEHYVGVDIGQERTERLRKTYPQHQFFRRDFDEDPLDFEGRFDTILLIAVIEHVFNQKHLATELVKKLKPAGRIIVTTPTSFGESVHRIGAVLGLLGKSVANRHIVIFNKRRFKVLAGRFNLRIEKYHTFCFGCNQLVILAKKD